MPERLRSIAARLRELVGNRRRAPRFKARLPVAVSLLDARSNAHPPTAAGHTHDLSESGLGVVLPGIRIGDRYLAGEGLTLRVTLKLPGAHARLYGTPVRYERLEGEAGSGGGFLIGIRITEADEEDRRLLTDYLRKIKG